MFTILILFAALFGSPPAAEVVPADLSGIYLSESESYDQTGGTALAHSVTIITKIGAVYRIESIGAGYTVGIGRLTGKTFSVAWRQGNATGLAVYKYEMGADHKSKLVGAWVAIPGDAETHSETLRFLRSMPMLNNKDGVN